jgi:hypothetical protein
MSPTIDLISGIHYFCEKRKYAFNVLPKYYIITQKTQERVSNNQGKDVPACVVGCGILNENIRSNHARVVGCGIFIIYIVGCDLFIKNTRSSLVKMCLKEIVKLVYRKVIVIEKIGSEITRMASSCNLRL